MSTEWQQTCVSNAGVKANVTDDFVSADRGPRRLAWMIVLHHQRETVPGEIWTDVLLIHHSTHTVTHTVEQQRGVKAGLHSSD